MKITSQSGNTPVRNLKALSLSRARAHHSFQTHLTTRSFKHTRHNGRPIRLRLAAAAAPPTRAMRHEISSLPVAPAGTTGRYATQDADGGTAVSIRLVDDRATAARLTDAFVASPGDGDELRE